MAIVTKEYSCEKCGIISCEQHHEETTEVCWKCGGEIEQYISAPLVAKLGGPRTVGSLIEQNNKNNPLTREKKFGVGAEKKLAQKEKLAKIARMTPEQKKKYIETGKGL